MLTVAYDGTRYAGFQFQTNAKTVQEVLERGLKRLFKQPVRVSSASRTDKGVHSLGNLVVFDTESPMPAERICLAVNEFLPADVKVVKSEEVPLDFHPRKCKSRKTYVYRILNRVMPEPTLRLYTYHWRRPLDLDAMREGAACLVGEHDFVSYASIHHTAQTTVRTIYELSIEKTGDVVEVRICGSGFLYYMVRIIVGTLLEVGTGLRPASDVQRILEAKDRAQAGATAPACGLTMLGIELEEPYEDISDLPPGE